MDQDDANTFAQNMKLRSIKIFRKYNLDQSPYPRMSITSVSVHNCLTKRSTDVHILVNAKYVGMVLLCLVKPKRTISLKKQIFTPSNSLSMAQTTRSCFSPLIPFKSKSFAVTGSEDGNVYLYNIITSQGSNLQTSLVSTLQGHNVPVTDVTMSWDEKVLASGDQTGSVIIWNRKPINCEMHLNENH